MAAVTRSYLGPSGVIVAALLVSLVIFDTTLVTISRSRAGQPVLIGGRDHLTHRLVRKLGTPRHVALALAVTQLAVCGLTIAVAQAGVGWVLLAGAVMAAVGGVLIWQLETVPLFRREAPATAASPVHGQAVVIEPVAAEPDEVPAAAAAAAAQIAH
jgi:hypothetical protein